MRVLLFKDKHETRIFLAKDKPAELACFMAIFLIMLENGFYEDYEEPEAWDVDKIPKDKQWYLDARKGIADAARKLVEYRKYQGCEYEDLWSFQRVEDPEQFVRKTNDEAQKLRVGPERFVQWGTKSNAPVQIRLGASDTSRGA